MPNVSIWQVIPWWPVIFIGSAALAFYIASRLGAAALDHRGDNPAGAAAAHWLPIAAVTITVLKHYPHAAVSIIFASSVACLTLVPGVTLMSTAQPQPLEEPLPVEPLDVNGRRAWSMVLPSAMLVMLAGFKGYFTLTHAALFAIQGLVTLFVWSGPNAIARNRNAPRPSAPAIVTQILFWIGLTLVGAVVTVIGITDIAARIPHLTTGLMGALMVAPALVLPMIGSGLSAASRGRGGAIISTGVDCVLLNLCVLLPIAIVTWRIRTGGNQPLPYPMASWRIDAVALVVFGAALLITSTKRWVPGKIEGLLGIAAFAAYMIANKSLAIK